MSKEMVISANPHETRVAIMEEGQLCEFYVEREKEFALVGSIYKGRVTRVLPGMQSAFVDIGLDGDAFLYVSDFLEDIEEFDHIVTTAEDKIQKMEQQGGQVFAGNGGTPALEPTDVEAGPGVAPASATPSAESSDSPANGAEEPNFNLAPPADPALSSYASSAPGVPTHSAPPQDRGRDRGRFEHRRGGRNFGGRGGRFGRGGGRGRGGRGGDRRYGRDLPPSKYASPRSYEDRSGGSSDMGPADGHVSVILPGESLAKYRDRAPSPVGLAGAAAAPALESTPPAETHAAAPESATTHETVREAHEDIRPVRPDFHASSSHGMEPLPGESIAKWKT